MITGSEEKQLHRIRSILLFITGRVLLSGLLEDTFYLEPDYFASRSPLLQDKESLLKACERITRETNRNIILEPRDRAVTTSDGTIVKKSEGVIYLHIEDETEVWVYADQIDKKLGIKKEGSEKIKRIDIIMRDEDSKAEIVINGQHSAPPIRLDVGKEFWGKLKEVAEDGSARSDDVKNVIAYFNKNKKCPIYSNTSFDLTEILIAKGNSLFLSSKVAVEVKHENEMRNKKHPT